MDLAKRERIASEVLGVPVKHGDTLRCKFEGLHSHANGPRDLRVCLDDGPGIGAPGFYCFHQSCADDWAPINKELRQRIWRAEHGRDEGRPREWDGVAAEPQRKLEGEPFSYEALAGLELRDWPVNEGGSRSGRRWM